jgi:hypothetical protein
MNRLIPADQVREIAYRDERTRLLEKFASAIRELVTLNKQQIRAVIERDEDFTSFEVLIGLATQKKNAAKHALLKHIERHDC